MDASSPSHVTLNSMVGIPDRDGRFDFEKDAQAANALFLQEINAQTRFYHDTEEKLAYLVENEYYEAEFLAKYSPEFLNELFQFVFAKKFRFKTYMGAKKFYASYALKDDTGEEILERYEDRVAITALYLADGDEDLAMAYAEELIEQRFQPATPTFLNAGKFQRGELVSCMLINVEDDLSSIMRANTISGELSKRGAGVALNLSDIRAKGDPIQRKHGRARGVVPWMKIYASTFLAVDQLGQRAGAGAVYLNAHHMDVYDFMDSRRLGASEDIRVTTLNLGLVIPDITMQLLKSGEDMYLFSPYDVEKKYGVGMSQINITEKYRELVEDPNVRKRKTTAREFFEKVALLQSESGYPYILYVDAANRANPIDGWVGMSNLCTEILQVSSPNVVGLDQQYEVLGRDISCNLGSANIAHLMQSPNIGRSVELGMRMLTEVSDTSNLEVAPSIKNGNSLSHAVGYGVMNLHGYLASKGILYGSPAAIEFTDALFRMLNYYTLQASTKIARERAETFHDFDKSDYAGGQYFDRYIDPGDFVFQHNEVADLFSDMPRDAWSARKWETLSWHVQEYGLYHAYRMAVAPTGSISYLQYATASMEPVKAKIEARDEGNTGRTYYPAYGLTNENMDLYPTAYELPWKQLIDMYAAATPHVDQGISLTLYHRAGTSTREINIAQAYAHHKGIKTLYYTRVKRNIIDGTDSDACEACSV